MVDIMYFLDEPCGDQALRDRLDRQLSALRDDRRAADRRELVGTDEAAACDHAIDRCSEDRIGRAHVANEILPEAFAVPILVEIEKGFALGQHRDWKAAYRFCDPSDALARCLWARSGSDERLDNQRRARWAML
ncbi:MULTISPECIES: hypothetical protein [unclassified Sphingopyxis]|nr:MULTISPECIES: hypothetical protein [unclassified Sphingopyxis]